MGKIKPFDKEKLIIGIIYNSFYFNIENIKTELERNFGFIDFESNVLDFKHTDYYNDEMGENLKKIFFSFKDLIYPNTLSSIKIKTNKLEENFFINKGRKINLDPGILSLAKLILASTKNFSHRIPLNDGIYGEVTLSFKNGKWVTFPYTFPDYQTNEYLDIFQSIRSIYKNQILENK